MTNNLLEELKAKLSEKTYESEFGVDSDFYDEIEAITDKYETEGILCSISKEHDLENGGYVLIKMIINDNIINAFNINFSREYNEEDESQQSTKITVLDIYEDDYYKHIVSKGNQWGKMITTHWDSVTSLMDVDLKEQARSELIPCSNDKFLIRYCELHFEKCGEEFIAEQDNPQW